MAKIMLVEDDNNLRQIYQDRLAAEGYEIVAAADGEAALALAVKERPDLIIADIMMPKVSGFDMLDILRSTPETKDAKIIMMTALSQAEDQTRAEKLGADKYLVKSQVTLEDVVEVAAEMLGDQSGGAALAGTGAVTSDAASVTPAASQPPAAQAPATAAIPVTSAPESSPAIPSPAPTIASDTPVATPAGPSAVPPTPAPAPDSPAEAPAAPATTPASAPASQPANTAPAAKPSISIPVTSDDETSPASSSITASSGQANAVASSTADSEDAMKNQIDEFIASNPTLTTSAEPTPTNDTSSLSLPDANPKPETPSPPIASTTAAPAASPVDSPPTSTPPSVSPAPSTAPSQPATAPPTPVPSAPAPASAATAAPTSPAPPTNASTDQSSNAMAAMDGLLEDTLSQSETPSTDPADKPAGGYVSEKNDNNQPESQSMVHTKRIEPSADITNPGPNINELLAEEANHPAPTPPPVNSVITPGGGSISPLPGSSVEEAIEGGANKDGTGTTDDITL